MSVTRVWDADNNQWQVVGGTVAGVATATDYLPLSGGVLTGFLTLDADPTAAMHAATKQYVDSQVGAAPDWDLIINKPASYPLADAWTTARTLTLSGDLSGSVSIKGNANMTLAATVANDSHSHSNYAATHSHPYAPTTALIAHTGTSSQVIVSGSGPSGGQNGDIWLQI